MLTEEQMKARKGKITSSVVYDVIHNPYKAWQRIWQLEDPEKKRALENQQNVQFGNDAEDVVCGVAAKRLGRKSGIVVSQAQAPFRVHPEHAWSADSTDATFTDVASGKLVAIGEVKTHGTGAARGYGEDGSEEIPERVKTQCRWHLIHWPEVDVCYAIAFLAKYSLTLQIHRVERDAEEEGKLWQHAERYYRDYIKPGKPPELDGSDDSKEALAERYTKPGGAMTTAGEMAMGYIDRRQELKKQIKPLEDEIRVLDNRIKDEIGNAQGLIYGGKTVAKYIDIKASVRNYPAMRQLRFY